MHSRAGALHVVTEVASSDRVARALRELDPCLFLERQLTLAGEEVWCVVADLGLESPPQTILEYRDPEGKPFPYPSLDLVDRVGRMERDGARLAASVIRRNAELVEARRRAARANYEAVTEDVLPTMSELRSPVLHRSVSLRMARDRERAQGRKR